MKYQAICFDLDGTLLDTIEDLADSMNYVLSQLGFSGHLIKQYKHYVGDGLDELAKRALPAEHRDEEMIATCVQAMRAHYQKHWADKTRPYSGVPQLLDALTALHIPMAVLSNKADDFTKLMVKEFFGKWSFAAVNGLRQGIAKKPDPTGALEIARLLKIEPAHWLYVGDTRTDMLTGARAGMFTVGVRWGFRDEQELISSGAKVIISRPAEILELLGD